MFLHFFKVFTTMIDIYLYYFEEVISN